MAVLYRLQLRPQERDMWMNRLKAVALALETAGLGLVALQLFRPRSAYPT